MSWLPWLLSWIVVNAVVSLLWMVLIEPCRLSRRIARDNRARQLAYEQLADYARAHRFPPPFPPNRESAV